MVQEAVYDDLGLPPGAEALPPRRLAPAEGQLAVPPVISGHQQELSVDDLPLQGEQVDRPRQQVIPGGGKGPLVHFILGRGEGRALLSTLDPHVFLWSRKPVRVL